MSGTVKRVAVRLALEGADQVRTQMTAIGETGQRSLVNIQRSADASAASFGSFRTVAGQAGFQLQDFVVQVQGGTSALTALSQQGSQFLGAFGPAGAIAGAVLTVGTLAAAFLTGRDNTEALKLAEESLGATYERNRELIQELTAATEDLNAARLQGSIAETQEQLGRALLAQDRLEEERRSIQRENELAQRARGALDQGLITQNQQRLDELNQRVQRAGEIADRIQQDLDRLTGLRGQFRAGEGLPTPPSYREPPSDDGGRAATRRAEREAERELNSALRDREGVLRSLEMPYDTYIRRLEELVELQDRLPENERLTNDQLQRATDRLQQDLERAERGTERVDDTARQLGLTFSSAFEDAIVKGESFRSLLKGIEADIARIIVRKAITEPLANAAGKFDWGGFFGNIFSSAISGFTGGAGAVTGYTYGAGGYYGAGPFTASANGNIFLGGNVVPFARGGVVGSPTFFPMANGGTGLMGEAGPEAIMPLRRDASGRLGVAAQGGGGNSMSFNISIDARGADAGVEQRIRVGMAMAVQEAQRQFAANINRGGSAAKTVGRRA